MGKIFTILSILSVIPLSSAVANNAEYMDRSVHQGSGGGGLAAGSGMRGGGGYGGGFGSFSSTEMGKELVAKSEGLQRRQREENKRFHERYDNYREQQRHNNHHEQTSDHNHHREYHYEGYGRGGGHYLPKKIMGDKYGIFCICLFYLFYLCIFNYSCSCCLPYCFYSQKVRHKDRS